MAALIVEFLGGVFLVLFTGYLVGSLLDRLTHKKHRQFQHE
jgi:hypothetical protein